MFAATVTTDADALTVTALHAGKPVAAWQLPANKAALANRLVRAIEAGKVVTFKDGVKSVNVIGRTLNADLKRLGF
jgi:hypothetical protein